MLLRGRRGCRGAAAGGGGCRRARGRQAAQVAPAAGVRPGRPGSGAAERRGSGSEGGGSFRVVLDAPWRPRRRSGDAPGCGADTRVLPRGGQKVGAGQARTELTRSRDLGRAQIRRHLWGSAWTDEETETREVK